MNNKLSERKKSINNLKTAIVHDWLTSYGGAERVVEELTGLFPDAPIYTSIYSRKLKDIFPEEKIRTSYMQKLPGVHKYYRKLLSLMPRAFEEFDFSDYDLVISSSSSCAKGILTPASAMHISYVHTPMRYAWDLYPEYLSHSGFATRAAMRRLMPGIRQWDALTALRVDYFLANSTEVAARIKKTYRRDSYVLHPPVNTDFFTPLETTAEKSANTGGTESIKTPGNGDYYLILSRFVEYKRIDLAIKACRTLNKPLVVIGSGPQEKELRKIAGPMTEFTGRLSDREIRSYYRNAKAFLFPGFEDFGITPVESMACGTPVIAYGKGGALDTVVPGKTGIFFYRQNEKALAEAIEESETVKWDSGIIRKHAEQFSRKIFTEKLTAFINKVI